MNHAPTALTVVQCVDGLGAGASVVVGVFIIADFTKGADRFNAAQGATATWELSSEVGRVNSAE